MDINYILLFNYDQIDYKDLSDDILKGLALSHDLFIATSALSELSIRKSKIAVQVAWKILSESKGDRYLQALALDVLFSGDKLRAIDFMNRHIEYCDPYLLNTMMEIFIENASELKSENGSALARRINKRLKEISLKEDEERMIDQKVREDFIMITNGSIS